jgi:hypothetical protein
VISFGILPTVGHVADLLLHRFGRCFWPAFPRYLDRCSSADSQRLLWLHFSPGLS